MGALTLGQITSYDVIEAFRNQEPLWEAAHWANVLECRAAQNGEQLFSLGENFDQKKTNRTRLRVPQTTTIPLKTINVMARRRPLLRRFAASPSPRHQLISSNIENWINSALTTDIGGRTLLDWKALVGKLFLEGACAVIASPSLASWERFPDFLDTIDEKKYKRMAPSKRERYKDQGDGSYARVDDDGEPLPKRRYWRDARGRSPDDDHYADDDAESFEMDPVKTEQAYEEALAAVLAHRPPFNVRVVSSTDAMPEYGPGGRLEAIKVRTRYTREALLRRNYYWSEDDEPSAGLVKRGDEDSTGSGDVTLYEYWGYDTDGTPFVAYAVEGVSGSVHETYFRDPETGKDNPAVINLAEEHGLTRLPATWVWGLNLETDDYPNKAVPFLLPTLSPLKMVEMFLSAKAAHALQHGFTSWAFEPDAEIIKLMPDLMLENNKPRVYDIEPMKAILGPGKPHALVAPTTSDDVNELIRTLLGMAGAMSPSEAAFGGPGAASGHDRSLTRDYLDTAMSQVLQSALEAYEFVAEMVLEIACAIEDRYDVKVPIYARTQVPQVRLLNRHSGDPPRVLELDPDWLDEIYDVQAYYPYDPFENIALINLYAQLYKDGLITWEEWRAIIGDEHPEMSRILLWVNQQINAPEGKALIAALANDIMGGDLEEEIKRLVADGIMTEDGEPVESLVDEDEMKALEYFANRRKAHWMLNGTGPMGPGAGPISPNALASTSGLLSPPPGPVPGGPGTVAPGAYGPPGQVEAPPPQGAPGQTTNIGTGIPNLPNSMLGGIIAGQTEEASIRRDALARP